MVKNRKIGIKTGANIKETEFLKKENLLIDKESHQRVMIKYSKQYALKYSMEKQWKNKCIEMGVGIHNRTLNLFLYCLMTH